jgi:phage recombination protein Bet
MSQLITLVNNPTSNMWTDEKSLAEIRGIICPSAPLSDVEFGLVVQIGRAAQLNPFLKEIWVIKYGPKSAAQIFIGRDGYRKGAQRQSDYEYHQVNAVYSEDEFRISSDEIQHSHGFSNRGELLGAYCLVKRKSASKPTYVMVNIAEYNLKQGLWTSKPETMIKKVAEAQALRQSFQEAFAGTYSDAELPQESSNNVRQLSGTTQTEKLKNLLLEQRSRQSVHGDELRNLIVSTQLSEERLEKALDYYNVSSLDELTPEQYQCFVNNLKKIKEKEQDDQRTDLSRACG